MHASSRRLDLTLRSSASTKQACLTFWSKLLPRRIALSIAGSVRLAGKWVPRRKQRVDPSTRRSFMAIGEKGDAGDIVHEGDLARNARNAAATISPFGSEAHLESLPRPDGTNCRIRGHRWSRRARSFSSKLRQRLSAGKTWPVIHNSGWRNSRVFPVRKRFTRETVDVAWRANGRHIFPSHDPS